MRKKMGQVQQKTFLTPAELVQRWDDAVTTGTLANWRSKGQGPAFQKFGSRVRYTLAAVEAYERANQVGGAANDNDKAGKAAA